jgi:hypothetical protein
MYGGISMIVAISLTLAAAFFWLDSFGPRRAKDQFTRAADVSPTIANPPTRNVHPAGMQPACRAGCVTLPHRN